MLWSTACCNTRFHSLIGIVCYVQLAYANYIVLFTESYGGWCSYAARQHLVCSVFTGGFWGGKQISQRQQCFSVLLTRLLLMPL